MRNINTPKATTMNDEPDNLRNANWILAFMLFSGIGGLTAAFIFGGH